MVAYDNALLYRPVEQLAGNDPLTALHNRRQFVKLSTELCRLLERLGCWLAGPARRRADYRTGVVDRGPQLAGVRPWP
jgi:hypothetical protein